MAGLYTTRLASWSQGSNSAPRGAALDRSSAHQMKQWDNVNGAIATIRTAFAAQSAVIKHATHLTTTSGGNYTLTVSVPTLGVTYTTANIAHDATAATIESALDTASPATVGDGDIAVAEENSAGLSDGYCTFTCSGDVASIPVFITSTDVDLSGSGHGLGAITYTTQGQAAQVSKQALFDMNVVSGTRNEVGTAPSDWTKPASNGQSRPRLPLIRALAQDCTDVDGSSEVWTAILDLYPDIANVG